MKKLFILITIILAATTAFAVQTNELDSLKQKLQNNTNDTLKGAIYTQIAAQYLNYDTISNRRLKTYYQNEALNYSMLALHNYSYFADTAGLVISYDNLSRVYKSQKKYSQAKWFILQSNNLLRIRKDTPAVILSLVKLATIKMEIKDYRLAMRDLNEALSLSIKNNLPLLESNVQQNYGFLYNRMKDYTKGDIATKRSEEILDSLKNDQEMKEIAANQPVQDTEKVKKAEPVVKKKVPIAPEKKTIKNGSIKKLASL